MIYKIVLVVLVLLFSACESKPKEKLDAKKLIDTKCGSCHNLELPPKSYENEIAPPMMAVSFHIINFMQVADDSMKVPKAKEFVKDYVINPSAKKSFCDKKSLQEYGVMPSQKGKVSEDELDAISSYMFSHFTQKNLNKAQQELNKFNKLSEGEKIALKNNCLTCHRVDKDLVGPSFKNIKNRYKNNTEIVKKSIIEGSKQKWKITKGAIMPSFKNLSNKELEELVKWIFI
jgi:cytochrome c